MAHRFRHHYTREEARKLLPQIREWFAALDVAKRDWEKSSVPLNSLLSDGCDVGGDLARRHLHAFLSIRQILGEFSRREIMVKDIDRGLIDFPAFHAGREVFLCWERGEPDVEHWHELDAGYAGREPLGEGPSSSPRAGHGRG